MDHNLSQAIDYLNSEKEVEPELFRCDSCEQVVNFGARDERNCLNFCSECLDSGRFKKECYCEDTEKQIEEQKLKFVRI